MKFKKKEEYNYFDEFIKNSEYIVKSATILNNTAKDYKKENIEEIIKEVHKLENDADSALHKMRNYLVKDFLPPIDREDIILIGHKLDDIEDHIDEILINLNIYNIENIREEMIELTEILLEACESVKKALEEFKNSKKYDLVTQKTIEINKLEEKADRVFEKAMKRLYTTEKDSLEVMKWTEMFKCLENATDTCEHIADCLEDVVMKNS